MSKEKLQNQIINDLKNDFPNIIVEKEEKQQVCFFMLKVCFFCFV